VDSPRHLVGDVTQGSKVIPSEPSFRISERCDQLCPATE